MAKRATPTSKTRLGRVDGSEFEDQPSSSDISLRSARKQIFDKKRSVAESIKTGFGNDDDDDSDVDSIEISAPYELPHFPIERIETNKALQRKISSKIGYEQSSADVVPHFQHVTISGDNTSGLAEDDMKHISALLVQALGMRAHYMSLSGQSFSKTVSKFLNCIPPCERSPEAECEGRKTIEDHPIHPPIKTTEPWQVHFPPDKDFQIKAVDGVFNVFKDPQCTDCFEYEYPKLGVFVNDMLTMCHMIADGPLKSYCYRRLSYLSSKFQLHVQFNELRETAQQKEVSHRDFYNIRKVDTHVHASSCMNQKHLLRFIKNALKTQSNQVVTVSEGKEMTLAQVFQLLNLTTYDLTVDMLDVHAHRTTSHHLDKFAYRYNPMGDSLLREVFLKTNNHLKGRYFADIIKEVGSDLEESKYQNAELRLTLYGSKPDEWKNLAIWAIDNNVYSTNISWMVQFPRTFDIFKHNKGLDKFQDLLDNIFLPLFEATNKPNQHPELHRFLQHITGFDSVDDESKPENVLFGADIAKPQDWTDEENPPYSYYLYYLYANLVVLNRFRKDRGLNTFSLRPHCGQNGPIEHLVCGFLLADNISHGLLLRKAPVLEYLYYLAQIGVSMSPLSNNTIFVNFLRNPMPEYLARGLMVSLSTNDPLLLHFTKEPLMEEYSIAAQMWKLSSIDMCELARNSVIMSGFPHKIKQHWLGPNYVLEGIAGNDITRTNVPDIRVAYRSETLLQELTTIFKVNERQLKFNCCACGAPHV